MKEKELEKIVSEAVREVVGAHDYSRPEGFLKEMKRVVDDLLSMDEDRIEVASAYYLKELVEGLIDSFFKKS